MNKRAELTTLIFKTGSRCRYKEPSGAIKSGNITGQGLDFPLLITQNGTSVQLSWSLAIRVLSEGIVVQL